MTDTVSEARANLREHQQQLDADGCRVGVSRQALDEVLDAFDAMLAASPQGEGSSGDLAPIKPSADTGELRERVALEIRDWPFDISRIEGCLELADAILDLIQSERPKALPMTAQDLADHAADAFDNALPDDALPHEVGRAWKAVGERLAAILAERAEE